MREELARVSQLDFENESVTVPCLEASQMNSKFDLNSCGYGSASRHDLKREKWLFGFGHFSASHADGTCRSTSRM